MARLRSATMLSRSNGGATLTACPVSFAPFFLSPAPNSGLPHHARRRLVNQSRPRRGVNYLFGQSSGGPAGAAPAGQNHAVEERKSIADEHVELSSGARMPLLGLGTWQAG